MVVVGHIPAGVVDDTDNDIRHRPRLAPQRLDIVCASGLLLALIGTLFIILPKASLPTPGAAPWFAMALLTPALYAVTNVLADRLRPVGSTSNSLAAGMLVASTTVLAPLAFALDQFHQLATPYSVGDYAILVQIGASIFAYILFFEILRMIGAVQFSVTSNIITITGIGWGILLFSEVHSQ
jgi:drug/metabolite transporter (DMT)-like permease